MIGYTVLVRFEQVGMHRWPEAPDEVGYLRNSHRHLFKYVVKLEVAHPDRAVEVHTLKTVCTQWAARLHETETELSCENLAHELANQLLQKVSSDPYRSISVECWEDGECGGGYCTADRRG